MNVKTGFGINVSAHYLLSFFIVLSSFFLLILCSCMLCWLFIDKSIYFVAFVISKKNIGKISTNDKKELEEAGFIFFFLSLGVCHLYQGKTYKINGTLWWLSWKTSSTKCSSQIYQINEVFWLTRNHVTIQERSGKQECGALIMILWVARWSSVNEFNLPGT